MTLKCCGSMEGTEHDEGSEMTTRALLASFRGAMRAGRQTEAQCGTAEPLLGCLWSSGFSRGGARQSGPKGEREWGEKLRNWLMQL